MLMVFKDGLPVVVVVGRIGEVKRG